MIKTFRLRNFKAFEDTGDIELKPITVIAGPNSGGKTSILQSLLLLKQTLDAPPDTELSLDGQYLQYSGFSDLTFGKPGLSNCNVSFSFGLETHMPRDVAPNYFPGLESPDSSEGYIDFNTSIELSFRYRKRDNKGSVVLDSFALSSETQNEDGPRLSGVLLKGTSSRYKVTMTGEGIELIGPFEGRRIQDVILRHFIPSFFVLKEIKKDRGHIPLSPMDPIFVTPLHHLQAEIEDNLQYLGPLRERPQRTYLHSGNPMAEIGESGQYAAQILWIEKANKINYLPALGEEMEQTTLMEAVNDAFHRLGLFQPVDISSEKSMVYQILFGLSGPNTRKVVTIADVGFGVSQLLPILVLGLRSSESSILMFEQPEIHLHPKLQANLADFFLTLAEQGKRIVVETHSDHFINRLRRRIAEDPTDTLKEKVNILFVNPPQDGHGATIAPLRIDRYGIIENWPQDFLPEGTDEAQAIFGAGLRKRGAL